jgi:hypothetical protein
MYIWILLNQISSEAFPFFLWPTNPQLHLHSKTCMHFVECLHYIMVNIQGKLLSSYLAHNKHLFAHIPLIPQEMFKIIISMNEMLVNVNKHSYAIRCSHHDRTWSSWCLYIWIVQNDGVIHNIDFLPTIKPRLLYLVILGLLDFNQVIVYEPNTT